METQSIYNFKLKVLIVMALMMVFVGIGNAFSQAANLYKIQSLFLYNFTKHVKWENTEGAFTIGIYGNPKALAEIKSNLGSKIVWGKNINVIEITSPADISNCQLVYMPRSNKKKIIDFIGNSDLSNTLLVTEDDLTSDGAAISFVFEQSKMKFKISKTKIEEAGLKVSSSLISIGIPV
ncbi:MAG: YfiR family protein [Cytophagales bacterium]|nr:YfiR family protein [Cytophagales bacterium]